MFFAFVWFLTLSLVTSYLGRLARGGFGVLLGVAAFFFGAIALVFLTLVGAFYLWF